MTCMGAHSRCSGKVLRGRGVRVESWIGVGSVMLIRDMLFPCAEFGMGDCFCSTLE